MMRAASPHNNVESTGLVLIDVFPRQCNKISLTDGLLREGASVLWLLLQASRPRRLAHDVTVGRDVGVLYLLSCDRVAESWQGIGCLLLGEQLRLVCLVRVVVIAIVAIAIGLLIRTSNV